MICCVNSSTYEKLKKLLGEKFKKYDFVKVESVEENTIQFAEPYDYNCYIFQHMENIFEAQSALLETTKQLLAKVKQLKNENSELKTQVSAATSSVKLTDEQKIEIEKLLTETKEVLEENPLVGQTV